MQLTDLLIIILGAGVTLFAVIQIVNGYRTGTILHPGDPSLPKRHRAESPKAFWVSMAYYMAIVAFALGAAVIYWGR